MLTRAAQPEVSDRVVRLRPLPTRLTETADRLRTNAVPRPQRPAPTGG